MVTTDGSPDTPRVLIAHRTEARRRALRAALADCELAEAASEDAAIAALREGGADVLLLDHGLAGALPRVKGDPDLFATAVVLVGEPPDVADALDAIEQGAHDVLDDEAAPAEIVARVRAARRTSEMQAQLLAREADLEALAFRDELTGLANRRFALRQLGALVSRARRHERDVSVLMIDADRFKTLNDRHGHAAGDAVLRGLAERLGERVRREDVITRFGGEEFLVLAPDTDAAGAAALAEDLRAAVAERPFAVGRFALAVTVSIGWATRGGEDAERLVGRADDALYAAKDGGRDRVCAGNEARAR